MRRDFELHGSTLFVDRLGRPLNNKSWPLMTIEMLSGETKVSIPSDAIVISERVEAYAWIFKAAVDLTPGVHLSDNKVIHAYGLLAGENLLQFLGISDTCQILLDHYHLLPVDQDIGAWLRRFGKIWATELKEDIHDLVKTYDEAVLWVSLKYRWQVSSMIT
jgi:hypothetical protein